jgi:DNA modification methylase
MIIQGDCLLKLKELEDNSVDSIVTDPPYELGFMGKSWDNTGIANNKEMWRECLRVLKPGGHLLSFSGTRTYHRMACAIEDAGFEVRDMIEWVYGSGMSKCNVWGKGKVRTSKSLNAENDLMVENGWEGWGKGGLKPAHEPIAFCRKPTEKGLTVAENCLKWGTGGINIDESRVKFEKGDEPSAGNRTATFGTQETISGGDGSGGFESNNLGRFPANLIHDNSEEVRECFPETKSVSGGRSTGRNFGQGENEGGKDLPRTGHNDSGNASRFFKSILYYPKASKSERNKNTNNYLIIEICVENTEQVELPPKDISESIKKWLTELFGKATMEKYQMDILSTTKTETNKTMILITLNSKLPLNIKGCIADAFKMKTENGGSPADCVENTNELKQIIISGLTEFILGANLVQSKELLKISVNENNFHATVKPIALMEYLIKMITPKGGIVLDPFAGSGSTLVAAKQNGYKYIGIELTPEYIPIIEARLNAVPQKLL